MNVRLKVFLIASVVLICTTVSLAFVVLSDKVYPFTEDLTYVAGVSDKSDMNSYVVKFYGSDGKTVVASAYIRIGTIGLSADARKSMLVEVAHSQDTHLDSLTLLFRTQQLSPVIALESPSGGPWPPLKFNTVDGKNVLLDIPDFGFMGVGTVNFNFTFGPNPPPDPMILHINLSLHNTEDVVKLTKQQAKGSVLIELQK